MELFSCAHSFVSKTVSTMKHLILSLLLLASIAHSHEPA